MNPLVEHRRILHLTAVQPCDAVSPDTLLASVLALAHDIASRPIRRSLIHRRTVREVLRIIGAISVFLEDIRDHAPLPLPSSAALPFSELHITLQKLRHLLNDCARGGARLWILMRSDHVSCEFRSLIRTVATVLDVLPLDEIGATEDAKALLQMVARQAWALDIATYLEDGQAAAEVRSVLREFESGNSPDSSDIQRVLNQLGIRNWTECDEEVLFLEEEFFQQSDGEDGEAAFLCSLIGFMVYCRAVVFFNDAVFGKRSKQRPSKMNRSAVLDHINPEDLRCPISLELMTDPVTVSTGQTYDRASILRWLGTGCLSCPVTGEKLRNKELVPNAIIRKLVVQFCQENNLPIAEPSDRQKRDLSKTLSPGSRAAEGATRLAISFLIGKLSIGTKEERSTASYEIRLLSKSSAFNRGCFVAAGSVPQLLSLLISQDPSAQEHSVAALLNLSKHQKGREAIFEAGKLRLILDVLTMGHKVEAQQNAAAILFYLSSIEEYRKEIGRIPEVIPALVQLLRRGTYRGKKNAVVTLFGLLLYSGNHPKVLEAEAIPALAEILHTEIEDLVNDTVAVLAKLAERPEGAKAILRSSAVPLVTNVLRNTTSRSGKEYCVSVLLSLCNNGGSKVITLLEEIPSLIPSLYSLMTEGSPQACKKARSLLNRIHRFYDLDYPVFLTSPARDSVVHAQ